jgi:3-methylcrotonyl-CoA carboxylase alpha subunit
MADALAQTLIAGPRSNVAFLGALCRMGELRRGEVDTGFIDRALADLGAVPRARDCAAAASGVERLLGRPLIEERCADADSPWAARDGFQLGGTRRLTVPILVDGESAEATATYGKDGPRVKVDGSVPAGDAAVFEAGDEAYVLRGGRQTRVRLADFAAMAGARTAGGGLVKAPMHGRLLQVFVAPGEEVAAGQRLAIIEAMKMEHTLYAPCAGVVREIAVAAGAQVGEGGTIMLIEPAKTR